MHEVRETYIGDLFGLLLVFRISAEPLYTRDDRQSTFNHASLYVA